MQVSLGPWCPFSIERLAETQRANGKLAEAETSYHEAQRLYETGNFAKGNSGPCGRVRSGLARCLLAAGRVEEAEGLYRQALQSSPGRDDVRAAWAWFLATRPDADRRVPGLAVEFANNGRAASSLIFSGKDVLGVAQYRVGDYKSAAATLGGAVKSHFGRENGAGFFLAMAYWQLGEKEKAMQGYREAINWTHDYRPRDQELLRIRAEATRLLGAQAEIELANFYADKKQYATAARAFAAAFAADPKLADDAVQLRFLAALAAAQAGNGQGEDIGSLNEQERERFRQQALDLCRAEFARWTKQLAGSPQSIADTRGAMVRWRGNMMPVRDPKMLAKLPETERQQWEKLWADVEDALRRAER